MAISMLSMVLSFRRIFMRYWIVKNTVNTTEYVEK